MPRVTVRYHALLREKTARDSESFDLTALITRQPPKKSLKINGVLKKSADFIGRLKTVFFSPDDLLMIYGEPAYGVSI